MIALDLFGMFSLLTFFTGYVVGRRHQKVNQKIQDEKFVKDFAVQLQRLREQHLREGLPK